MRHVGATAQHKKTTNRSQDGSCKWSPRGATNRMLASLPRADKTAAFATMGASRTASTLSTSHYRQAAHTQQKIEEVALSLYAIGGRRGTSC